MTEIELERMFQEGLLRRRMGRYKEAIKILMQSYKRYVSEIEERKHKGHILFELSIAWFMQGVVEKAAKYNLLAFIEDFFTYNMKSDTDTPAGKNLVGVYRISEKSLEVLKKIVAERKSKGFIPNDPQEILSEFMQRLNKKEEQLLDVFWLKAIGAIYGFDPNMLPGRIEERVFVGGKYGGNEEIFSKARIIISKLGFQPIIAYEFKFPKEKTRQFCFLLIANCTHAVWIMPKSGGHLNEIEFALSIPLNSLYICPKGQEKETTKMIETHPLIKITTFKDDQELSQKMRSFLRP